MNKEKLLKVFDFLETTMNPEKVLYFKLLDKDDKNNQIGAYFKIDNRHFADFYINAILEIIRSNENEK